MLYVFYENIESAKVHLPIVFATISQSLLSSYFLYLSKPFSSKNWHRERIVGWVGKYSILSIQFSRKMTRPSQPTRPPPSFQPNIIAETRIRDEERRGVTKEKNKFVQSEGGGYRFGYGFRKRRRILFLRKPDKGSFTRIFSHTRRLHLRASSYASRKRDENITNGLPYLLSIHQSFFRKDIFYKIS